MKELLFFVSLNVLCSLGALITPQLPKLTASGIDEAASSIFAYHKRRERRQFNEDENFNGFGFPGSNAAAPSSFFPSDGSNGFQQQQLPGAQQQFQNSQQNNGLVRPQQQFQNSQQNSGSSRPQQQAQQQQQRPRPRPQRPQQAQQQFQNTQQNSGSARPQQQFQNSQQNPAQNPLQNQGPSLFPQTQQSQTQQSQSQQQQQQSTSPPLVFINNRPTVATEAPFDTNTTTPSARYTNCFQNCPTTSQYNPICGSDMQLYYNEQKFECARNCGADIQIVRRGSCAGLFPMMRG